jgi:hypothetical protein
VPGLRWSGCLQPDDHSNDSHPGVMRFQIILDQMSGGTQCRLEIGLMTVPLHQVASGSPNVCVRKQVRSNQVGKSVLAQYSISRNPPEGLLREVAFV